MSDATPGPRDHLITGLLLRRLEAVAPDLLLSESLDSAEAADRLARHAMEEIRRGLGAADEDASEQTERVNRLLLGVADADAAVATPPRILHGVLGRSALGEPIPLPPAPATPFSQSDLLVNAEGQPNVGSELRAELATADSVDLICAFVIWSGVRHLREALEGVDRARRRGPCHHDDLHGRDREAGRRRACALGARGPRRVRRADDQAARQGVAARTRARGLPPHSSAPRTSRTRRCSTGSNGMFGSLRWTRRMSSTAFA